jgi:hypothetical protein
VDAADSPAPPQAAVSPRAYRLAWVAARLHSVSKPHFARFTAERLRAELSWEQARLATRPLRERSSWRGRQGRPPANPMPGASPERPVLREWLAVEEPEFGLLRVLYRLPNDGLPRPALLAALAGLPGMRQLREVEGDREVLAVALVEDMGGAAALRARIEDHAPGGAVRMDMVSYETHEPARRTWIELARAQLGLDQGPG